MDLHMIDEIWAFRKYDYFGFKVERGSAVVDIGANIGSFAIYAARACGASRVVAFEPHPENFALLTRNVSANGLTNVTCVNAAVGASRGKRHLEVDPGNSGGHRLSANPRGQAIEVDCLSLDDVIAEHRLPTIDYLKLDCEGAEYEIVESCPEAVNKTQRISMEYHAVPGRAPEQMRRALELSGFSVRCHERERLYAQRIPI
jgi:FkbM family methyltransferase